MAISLLMMNDLYQLVKSLDPMTGDDLKSQLSRLLQNRIIREEI